MSHRNIFCLVVFTTGSERFIMPYTTLLAYYDASVVVVGYDRNVFIIQATGRLFLSLVIFYKIPVTLLTPEEINPAASFP